MLTEICEVKFDHCFFKVDFYAADLLLFRAIRFEVKLDHCSVEINFYA